MQQFLVIIIVAGAGLLIGRRLWRVLRRPERISCGCGCSGCDLADSCTEPSASLPLHKR